MATARVKLSSVDKERLSELCSDILKLADKTGAKHSGIIYLPTKKMVVPTRKSMCGGGTETYEKWQMRVHKRLIDLDSNEKLLKRVMRLEMSDKVYVEIELKD
jgi:small subunit ribosomal protein S10